MADTTDEINRQAVEELLQARQQLVPDKFAIQRTDTGQWLALNGDEPWWTSDPKMAATWDVRPDAPFRQVRADGFKVSIGRLPVSKQLG
jgi:hypothetical protein